MAALFLRSAHLPETYPQLPLLRSTTSREDRLRRDRDAHDCGWLFHLDDRGWALGRSVAITKYHCRIGMDNRVGAISLCSALVGDVWRILNPWSTLFAAAELVYAGYVPPVQFHSAYPILLR